MNEIWKSWNEVKRFTKGKKIVLFGRSEDWVHKTLPHLTSKPLFIVDNNYKYQKTTFNGIRVLNPKELYSLDKNDIYVVVTAGNNDGIFDELIKKKFIPGINFCATPEIRDIRLFKEVNEYNQTIIVTSSDKKEESGNRSSKLGGGLFLYNTIDNSLERKIEGQFRQMVQIQNSIYVVEQMKNKIYKISLEDFKILDKFDLDYVYACGLAYDAKRKLLCVANVDDVIHFHDINTMKEVNCLEFSKKNKRNNIGNHHVNDICIHEDSLYVSYFSKSGNWKKEVFDGGIDEFYLEDLSEPPQTLVRDKWMPHSIDILDGNLCFAESMLGKLWIGTKNISGEFPGFIRGLDYDNRFYFIGQSATMYMHRLLGLSNNIMQNAGIYLFDSETKVSRFYSFPDLVNIHDILIEKKNK